MKWFGPMQAGKSAASLLMLAIFVAGCGALSAGINVWTSIGPEGGTIQALAIDPRNPGTLYAVTDWKGVGKGVFKSTNGGASWNAANSGLPAGSNGHEIYTLAVDPRNPSTLYAGTYAGTYASSWLFKSTDGGMSWSAVNFGSPYTSVSDGVIVLAIDPQNTSTLYVGTLSHGVLKSTDGGASWNTANSGLPTSGQISALAVDPQNPGILYAALEIWSLNFEGRLFKSTDGGRTWNATSLSFRWGGWDPATFGLEVDPQNPNRLYAWTGNGLFKSTDEGASWAYSGSSESSVGAFAVDPQNPNTVYAAVSVYDAPQGILKSTDGGANWSAVNSGLTTLSVTTLAIDPKNPNTVYAGTDGGGVFAITFAPKINSGGIVSGSTFQAAPDNSAAPGGLISIFGRGLAPGPATASSLPLPAALNGTTVLINNVPAPLFFVSPGQINAQVPFSDQIVPGKTYPVIVRISGQQDSPPQNLQIDAVAPGIFTVPPGGTGQGAVLNLSGKLMDASAPAKPGDTVAIFASGLGVTNPPLTSGAAGNGQQTVNVPAVTVGGQKAAVSFAGAAPGFAALYQINVIVPDLSPGSYDVVITTAGKTSAPGVKITIGGR